MREEVRPGERPAGGQAAPPAGVRYTEWMLLAYLAASSVIGLARLRSQPAIMWVLGANLLYAALIFLCARAPLGRIGRVLREIYPLLLLAALYPAIDILNNFGAVSVHDLTIRGWEHALFGGDVSRLWWQQAPSRFWSTVLHGAYFAYYPVMAAPLVVFLAMGRADDAERAVRWLLTVYIVSYLVFLLFPVAGPYYEFPRPAAWFLDNPAARLVYSTLERGSAYGAAFPSSHVAATLVATAAAFRGSRLLGWILSVPAVLLTVGVVYCQMHYAVDALAGVFLALVVVVGWSWWERVGQTGQR
jgi:membrane-associated phospholipid phosphatase